MTRRMRIDDLTALAVPSQPALSPDGARVAYVLRTLDADADRNVDQLWRSATAGGTPRRLTTGTADTAPAWSPDGARLAFLRGRARSHAARRPRRRARAAHRPAARRRRAGVEPGRRADRLHRARSTRGDDDDRATRAAPIVTDRLDYQADGAGLLRRRAQPAARARPRDRRRAASSPTATEHAGEPAWSPDGTQLAFTARSAPTATSTFRTAVHLLDVDDPKAAPRVVAFADGVAGTVSFAADGDAPARRRLARRPGRPRRPARGRRSTAASPVDLAGTSTAT